MSSTNSPKLTKAELKKKQKDEELAKKKLQDDLNLVEKKKSKSHSILNNPIIKFKKKEDVSKEIPMSEDEVDEEYTKILVNKILFLTFSERMGCWRCSHQR
jgi:hypothetical protein